MGLAVGGFGGGQGEMAWEGGGANSFLFILAEFLVEVLVEGKGSGSSA